MTPVKEYSRPATIADAVALIAAGGRIVAGGTKANRKPNPFDGPPAPRAVVDIQDLGLTGILIGSTGTATLEARVTLQQIADQDGLPPVVREAARREAPRPVRNAATVGGTIASRTSTSELLAALLVYEASVHIHAAGESEASVVSLADALAEPIPSALVTKIELATHGDGAAHRVGRTPADAPIVAAVGREVDGRLVVALAGADHAPRLVAPDAIDQLDPPPDFRGSSEYRRHLAAVLTSRVARELSE